MYGTRVSQLPMSKFEVRAKTVKVSCNGALSDGYRTDHLRMSPWIAEPYLVPFRGPYHRYPGAQDPQK